ncbi:hypothetical protein Tco_0178971 [Tanacetum coccineum]
MKVQELKIKTSVNSDIQDLPLRYQVYQGRLLASFLDDAKYEHVGQDTRSQGGKDDQRLKDKDLKTQTLQEKEQRQMTRLNNDKSNLFDLMKEYHNELTSGKILFHSWLLRDSFDEVIKMELPKLEEHNFGMKLLSHENFCLLKARIKQWHSETKTFDHVTKHDNLQLIKSKEEKMEAGSANDDDRDSRIKLLQETKTDKAKRRAQMIYDIMKEGVWILDPSQIKEDFLNFFDKKFNDHDSNVNFPPFANSFGLCALDRDILETPVSLDEVKNAVWDCGSSKAPRPDRFLFAFVKKYWDDIKVGILEFFNIFLDTSSLPHGSNSSFFTLIPKEAAAMTYLSLLHHVKLPIYPCDGAIE